MKKILILSYHFPPMNVIASQRALGYANHFKKFGYEPTVVTFDWSASLEDRFCKKDDFFSKIKEETYPNYKVIRIPVLKTRFDFMRKWEGKPFYGIWVLWSWLRGYLDVSPRILMHGNSELYFLKKHLSENSYDVLLAIFSPHFHLRNAYKVHKIFNLKYVLDFRDLWDNRIIDNNYSPSIKERIQDFFCRHYWRKWASKSRFETITSKPWSITLDTITQKKSTVITNGYDNNQITPESLYPNHFSIIHSGSLYSKQNIDLFFEGYKAFLDRTKATNVKLILIGADRSNAPVKGGNFKGDIHRIVEKYGISDNVCITKRMNRDTAIAHLKSAHLLYFPSFPSAPGTYSGKIFEYLATGIPIISVPSDNGVVDELLMETNSGVVLNSKTEISDFIQLKYQEWIDSGHLIPLLNTEISEMVQKYSRSNQTCILAEKLNFLNYGK